MDFFRKMFTQNSPQSGDTTDSPENGTAKVIETEQERRERLLSLKIIYFTMFLISLGFSIILTGIWPYLDKVIMIILMF
jgi:hypothetical protein